ncbi:patatin-like phospholipase family protein [Tessaracoccus sp. Z1128]
MAVKGWFGLPLFGQSPRPEVVSCTLSGGGSRAGFQLGALDYLYRHDEAFSPSIFVGASAGAIVASALAQDPTRDGQQRYLNRLTEIWMAMTGPADMFTPRPWFERLQAEAPGWLEVVTPIREAPARTSRPRAALLPFLRYSPGSPSSPAEPAPPPDPLELALTPDEDVRSDWSLTVLSGIASHLGRLPRIGTGLSTIWQGMDRSRSMFRPGPMLAHLLDPDTFDPGRVAASGVTLRIAMVSLESGELRFMTEAGTLVDRRNDPVDDTAHNLAVGVLASCAIPAVFRPVPLGDETYVDGGARENLPAELTIGQLGAARNYVISSQASGVPRRPSMVDADMFSVVMRATEILIDEAGRDELAYAHSAGAIVIHPELGVHDSMTVHPGLIAINRDYGWLRAAERHLGLGESAETLHRRITALRMRILRLEEQLLSNPEPARRDFLGLRSAKVELRDAVRSTHGTPLPDGADSWWTTWERHPVPPSMQPPWMPLTPQA